ncbi:hypothetical protein QLQ85_08810 [Halomonas sp. M4R5S39]|nr:hypothetical protein [Halomonas kalidii]MDI5984890.1 hypothetical protein [Halomonas kalidii]
MIDATLIEAINAGGNVGLLLMGLYMMKLSTRVNRLEIARELEQRASR